MPGRPRSAAEKPVSQIGYPSLAAFLRRNLFTWAIEYLSLRFGRRHPFPAYAIGDSDQGIYPLQGDQTGIRIALAGDWATGTDEAACVGKSIEASKPHYSIHLGDVYFVGGAAEVDENFLGISNPANGYDPTLWPTGSCGSFALNGNHEMYARGFAYFDRMLPKLGIVKDGAPQGQKASFFCLENEYWRIIALDTGYNSVSWPLIEDVFKPGCALRPEQIEWLRQSVQLRPSDPHGVILLTHHQYYSRFDDWFTQQAKQLAEFISTPVLWFWGHEHRLAIYPENGIEGGIRAYGRCIGHGGMPVDLPPAKPKHADCPVEFVDYRHYKNDEHLTLGYNGYAQLTLRNNQAEVAYADLHGNVVYSETWVTDAGVLRRTQ